MLDQSIVKSASQKMENNQLDESWLDGPGLLNFENLLGSFAIPSLNSPIVKSDEDDRIVALVDRPEGSPISCGSPSPSLPESPVSTFIFPASPAFNQLESLPNQLPDSNLYDYDIQENFPTIKSELKNSKDIADSLMLTEDVNASDSIQAWLDQQLVSGEIKTELPQELLSVIADNNPLSLNEVSSSTLAADMMPFIEVENDLHQIISDSDLLNLSVKDLNRRLSNQIKPIQLRLKQRRRTLKNRGYAQNCRTKRVKNQEELEKENKILCDQVISLKKKLNSTLPLASKACSLKRENDTYLAEVNLLRNEVTHLRSENQQLKFVQHSVPSPSSSLSSLEELCQ